MELTESKDLGSLADEPLIEQYRTGQKEAFAVLVNRYRQELFHYLARLLGGSAAADDVFQDTFLQVHLSIDRFDTQRRFRPWLFTIATNKARDHLRRNRRQDAVSLSVQVGQDQRQSYVDLMEADVPIPFQDAQNNESRQLVRQTVASLPDPLREVLLLSYFHQFSYKEVAQMLDIPLGTVKSRLHTAVGTFAKQWKARFDSEN